MAAPRWAAGFAAAAVLVLALAIPLWLNEGAEPSSPEAPSTTEAPTTTAVSTSVPPMVESWQRVGGLVMTRSVGLLNMTETTSGLVAVGFDPGEEDFRQRGVIFTSEDGVTWIRLAEDDPALNLGAVLIYGVTEGGPGIVAVGFGCENDAEPCMAYPTVWTSEDGTVWNRSAADPDVFGESGAMLDVVATEHGIIAAGGFYTGEGDTALIQPTVWLSQDGIEWERVWQGDGFDFSAATTITGFQALTVSPDGRVVGVGTAPNDQGDFVAAVWTTTDGRDWERIDPNSAAFTSDTNSDISVVDVASGPGGFVAVGTDGGTSVAIWHSPDGLDWTRADTDDQPFEYVGSLASVDALGTGWVAAGPHGFADMTGGTVTLWSSPDGLNWDRVHWIDPGYAMSVVTTDSGIAVAGAILGTDFHAAVWAGPAIDPAAPPPDPGPAPPPVAEEAIPLPEEGLSCEELADSGYGYGQVVSYWVWYDRPGDLDPDGNGAPCEAYFPTEEVEGVFGGAERLAVEIVTDYPTGTFSAAGPAVDDGVICAGGTIGFLGNPEAHPAAIFRWENLYTCDDRSGTFIFGADAFIDHDIDNVRRLAGTWDISSGTDGYVGLTGGGGADTVYVPDRSVIIGWVWLTTEEN
jgi:hypothetical protein